MALHQSVQVDLDHGTAIVGNAIPTSTEEGYAWH